MTDLSPRVQVRMSDIDNLLHDSIFTSPNGAKLVEYVKRKHGGGRVRLHNIFEQIAATQRPHFNFDSSDPQPLPEDEGENNVNGVEQGPSKAALETNAAVIEEHHQKPTTSKSTGIVPATEPAAPAQRFSNSVLRMTDNASAASRVPAAAVRQALLSRYRQSNSDKCELLRVLVASTPKNNVPDSASAFTGSISPIRDNDSPAEHEVIPATQPEQKIANEQGTEQVPDSGQVPLLAPSSQVSVLSGSKKVVVVRTPVFTIPSQPDLVVPETPSPESSSPNDSPRVPPNLHIKPRILSTTFNVRKGDDDYVTSDESDREGKAGDDHTESSGSNSILIKSILKNTSNAALLRPSYRVSFSQQLVQEREISPAPSIPDIPPRSDESSDESYCDEEQEEEEDEFAENQYQIIDEVNSDSEHSDIAELPDVERDFEEIQNIRHSMNDHLKSMGVQEESPSFNRDESVYETVHRGLTLDPLATGKKDNRTNLQLVDIITDWDDEDDELEEPNEVDGVPNNRPDGEAPTVTQPTSQRVNETNMDALDISSSVMEHSAERLFELPPPPLYNSDLETPAQESPMKIIEPPSQFTNSARQRFLIENDELLINRIQNELPLQHTVRASESPPSEKVSGSLVEIVQSFRDNPRPAPSSDVEEVQSKKILKTKNQRQKSSNAAAESYFNTVERTIANPAMPKHRKIGNGRKRRKLYDTKRLSDTSQSSQNVPKLRNLKIAVVKLEVAGFKNVARKMNVEISEASRQCNTNTEMPPTGDVGTLGSMALNNPAEESSNKNHNIHQSTNIENEKQNGPQKDVIRMSNKRTKSMGPRPRTQDADMPVVENEEQHVRNSTNHASSTEHPSHSAKQEKAQGTHVSKDQQGSDEPCSINTQCTGLGKRNSAVNIDTIRASFSSIPAHMENSVIPKASSSELQSLEASTPSGLCSTKEHPLHIITPLKPPFDCSNNKRSSKGSLGKRKSSGDSYPIRSSSSIRALMGDSQVPSVGTPELQSSEGNTATDQCLTEEPPPQTIPPSKSPPDCSNNSQRPVLGKRKSAVKYCTILSTSSSAASEMHSLEGNTAVGQNFTEEQPAAQVMPPPKSLPNSKSNKQGSDSRKRNSSIDSEVLNAGASELDTVEGNPAGGQCSNNKQRPVLGTRKSAVKYCTILSTSSSAASEMHSLEGNTAVGQNFTEEQPAQVMPPPKSLPDSESNKQGSGSRKRKSSIDSEVLNAGASELDTVEENPTGGQCLTEEQPAQIMPPSKSLPRSSNNKQRPDPRKGKSIDSEVLNVGASVDTVEEKSAGGQCLPKEQPAQIIAPPKSLPESKSNKQRSGSRKRKSWIESEVPTASTSQLRTVEVNPVSGQGLAEEQAGPPPKSSAPKSRKNTRGHREKHTTEAPEKVNKRKPYRLYDDDSCDLTWKPTSKSLKNQANAIRQQLDEGGCQEDAPVRRSKRTRRLAPVMLLFNPMIESAYDKPNYLPCTAEDIREAERRVKLLQAKEKADRLAARKAAKKKREPQPEPVVIPDEGNEPVVIPDGGNEPVVIMHEGNEPVAISDGGYQEDGETVAKKTRREKMQEPQDLNSILPNNTEHPPAVPTCSTRVNSSTDVTKDKQEMTSWMMKVMGRSIADSHNSSLPHQFESHIHLSVDQLTFKERHGIHYSFYMYSETENCGFLKFTPFTSKKLTRTKEFQLKFLMLQGALHFEINESTALVLRGGDFLVINRDTKYSIKNINETSLVFMMKVNTVPKAASPPNGFGEYQMQQQM